MNLNPENLPSVVFDHEKRIGEIEKIIPTLNLRMDGIVSSVEELKALMIQNHKDSMDTLKNVIVHDQTMEKTRAEFKQEFQRVELAMKQKQLEIQEKHADEKSVWERKQQEEKEKFEREQKAESKKMTRDLIAKMIVWGTPIVTTVVTVINQIIENFFK